MTQSSLFSSGFQLAPFVISSGLLHISWNAITSSEPGINSYKGVGLYCRVHQVKLEDKDLKIIVFETIPPVSQHPVPADLVSSSELKNKNDIDFDFLCTKSNPLFDVNKTAVSLLLENHQMLAELKTQNNINNSTPTPLIITGCALAGSVASLFTLSLLDTIGSGKNRPLCITFGSSLVGDKKLQQAISRSSTWNSCFLHVVSHKDPLPSLFITNHSSQTSGYMPSGTFLLSSDVGTTCSENPDFILELLKALGSTCVQNLGFQYAEYGNVVENLYRKAICKDTRAENLNLSDSLLASISLQLGALGLTSHLQGINTLGKIKNLEGKFIILRRTLFDPSKKLNDVKINMAQLEWYKKTTKKQGIGYYDSYRNMRETWDSDVVVLQKNLTQYWEKMIEEAEMKPQKEGAAFRTRWLYAGTNCRRMVEPLIIAQYYKEGGRDYVNKKRSKHFEKLEEWLKEGKASATSGLNSTSKHNVESILTLDSCFWAHVEEALLSCEEFKKTENEEARNKLRQFEDYVYEQLRNYAVSPEIFLPQSSYMRWWNEYKAIRGSSCDSSLTSFMSNATNYKRYAVGAFDFH